MDEDLKTIKDLKEKFIADSNTLSKPRYCNNGKIWVGLSAEFLVWSLLSLGIISESQVKGKFEDSVWTSWSGWTHTDVGTRAIPFRLPHDFDDLNRCINALNALSITYQQLLDSEISSKRGWSIIIRYWREICYLMQIYWINDKCNNILTIVAMAVRGNDTARDSLAIPTINVTFKDWALLFTPEFTDTQREIDGMVFKSSGLYKLLNKFLKDKIGFSSGNHDAISVHL